VARGGSLADGGDLNKGRWTQRNTKRAWTASSLAL
jgi:hypothetical protein